MRSVVRAHRKLEAMPVRIAIPEPTSSDAAYNARALPPYLESLRAAGAAAVVVGLNESPSAVAKTLATVSGIVLPGSPFDVDPERYGADRIAACKDADPARNAVDELLLQDAFNLRKPILAICYGVQSLNVWCNGTLIQDLPAEGYTAVNHAPGRTVEEAHAVSLSPGSRLAAIASALSPLVNSSHHQALRTPGDNLRMTATSPDDQVIEAVELDAPDHFVVGVQWHPERTYASSPLSANLFRAFVRAAETWHAQPQQE